MKRRVVIVAVLAGLITLPAAIPAGDSAAKPRPHLKTERLKTFASCHKLIRYARKHAGAESRGGVAGPPVAATATGAPSPGGAPGGTTPEASSGSAGASDSSQTNVQEAGVDEPDIVKSDGRHIFAVAGSTLHAVDSRASSPKLLDSLKLDGYSNELLLHGDRLLVISQIASTGPPGPEAGGAAGSAIAYPYYFQPKTLLTEVDVSDSAHLKIVRTEAVDGYSVGARLNGRSARVVLASLPRAIPEPALRSKVGGWVPSATTRSKVTGRRATRRLASCSHVRRPRLFSGLDLLTVLTVDMSKGLPAIDSTSLMTDAQTVYASAGSLYVATQKWLPAPVAANEVPPAVTSSIHRFDISNPDETRYAASGDVPGYLLNQFSMSEYKGVLRVASTDSPVWWGGPARDQSQSFVTVLDERSGALTEIGQLGGLGKGQRIYGVRFVDEAGFVVTFHQVDPLYTIDLSKPTDPKVLGQLELEGYSAYLHPIGKDLLLGIGRDANSQGATRGTQISLFDVSDLRNPKRLSQAKVGGNSSSQVEYDHHAFLYWAPSKLAVLPVQYYDGSNTFLGAIGYHVSPATGVDEAGRITHDSGNANYLAPVTRALVVGDRLFTLSDAGIKASSLSTFADEAWVPFPGGSTSGGGSGGPQPQGAP